MSGALELQAAINAAPNGGTITVDAGTCQVDTTLTLANDKILQGSPSGTTIDGSPLDATERILTLNDAGAAIVRDLTFIDSQATSINGAAIGVTGASSPTLDRLKFLGNTAALGGAVYLGAVTGTTLTTIRDSTFGSLVGGAENSANSGGALRADGHRPVLITGSRFVNNAAIAANGHAGAASFLLDHDLTIENTVFDENGAAGAGAVEIGSGVPVTTTLTGNTFRGNFADNGGVGGFAGALNVNSTGSLVQTGNLFDANTVSFVTDAAAVNGGAERVTVPEFTSRNDRFLHNELEVPASAANEAEGAGLDIEGCGGTPGSFQVENLVAAGNRFTGTGLGERSGAGVYVGCGGGAVDLTLLNSTIAGNDAGGSGTAGLFGGPDDTLTMRNSIVAGNTGADLSGFSSKTVTFSDACPLPAGAGNFCANPLLLDAAVGDVHQTAGSPTLDKGSNALIPAGLTSDFEGDARIQGAAVDIGADESVFPGPSGGGNGGGGGGGAQADTTTPGVSGSAIGKSFAVAKGSTPITGQSAAKSKVKRGTTIRYSLSEPATVSLRFDRALKGRRVKKGKRRVCAKPTSKNRKSRKCTRFRRAGRTLTRQSHAGKNSVKFSGRIGKKALKPGSYRLTIVATDAAGNKSKAKRLRFKIVKP